MIEDIQTFKLFEFLGHIGAAKKLIKNGATIDHENNSGETALIWAARNGILEIQWNENGFEKS